MGEEGREMVGKYAQDVTDYYCMASELDNHCVRESACHSIAEMAEKVHSSDRSDISSTDRSSTDRSTCSLTCRNAMLCRVCMVQIQPRKHVLLL